VIFVDAHLDLGWNALQHGRDLLRSVYTIRVQEVGVAGRGRAQGTVALPELRRGRVAVCCATLLARSTGTAADLIDYRSPEQAYAIAQGQLAYYRALERAGEVRILRDLGGLRRHIEEWRAWERDPALAETPPPVGFVIAMESADSVLDPGQLSEWWEQGLRVIGPAHYGSGRYAGGSGTEEGFRAVGFALLAEMERLGIVLDVTHLSDRAFSEALDRFGGTVVASHANCRSLVPHQRQLSDLQLRQLIARDGVIGAAFDIWMLLPEYSHGRPSNARASLELVVDQIDHVCSLAGNARHAGIGSDLDGGFGREQSPHDLDTIADLQQLPDLLTARGYSDADVKSIAHENWLRTLTHGWDN
jgi:membrane dipeptidase